MNKWFLPKGLTYVSPFFLFLTSLSLVLFPFFILAKEGDKKAPKPLTQSISLTMKLTGDLTDTYQFNGLLGERLTGSPDKTDPACENSALFREVIYRQKRSLEVWLQLVCTIQGQKTELKAHRFFVDMKPTAGATSQSVDLPPVSEKIKNVKVEISDLLVKPPKLK